MIHACSAGMHSLEGIIQIGDDMIHVSSTATNLGFKFDKYLCCHDQIKQVCKSSFYFIRNIAKIRNYLTDSATESGPCIYHLQVGLLQLTLLWSPEISFEKTSVYSEQCGKISSASEQILIMLLQF